jgi:NAD(P)-dependent dehydrogenase (short-subunit alcohol dehydrogenase family)
MDLQLQGRHVLVTGGSRGIGRACAEEFLREGCSVSIVGRDAQRVEQACAALASMGGQGGAVRGFAADLTDAAQAAAMIDRVEAAGGPVHVLVNSAGAARRTPFAELQPEDWRAALEAKFLATIHVLDPMLKRMAARGGGVAVNIVGMGGKIPSATHLAGGAANAALMLASAGLAAAYARHGVRVNVLNPAKTATDRVSQGVQAEARQLGISVAEATARAKTEGPLGRMATPQEIAAAAVFLASPRASYISGAILAVDGAAHPMVV